MKVNLGNIIDYTDSLELLIEQINTNQSEIRLLTRQGQGSSMTVERLTFENVKLQMKVTALIVQMKDEVKEVKENRETLKTVVKVKKIKE